MRFPLLILCATTACGGPSDLDDPSDPPSTPDDPVVAHEAWQPAPGTAWQWQLTGTIDTTLDVAMYDVDLFDAPDAVLDALSDRVVVCYFSAGTREEWRDDADRFPATAIGRRLDDWPDEKWVDVADAEVRQIMADRLDHAVARGCDGVEPDNVDGYANRNGIGLTAAQQLDYNRWLADESHARGLSVGLKNDLDQVVELEPWFDWALNESCQAWDECAMLDPFLEVGKAVFHTEYVDAWDDAAEVEAEVCAASGRLDTLIKTWDLGPEWLACP